MKNIYLLLLFTCLSASLGAQEQVTHVPISNTIVGIWKQTGATNQSTGKLTEVKTGNYKVINADGSYYTFIIWGNDLETSHTTIAQYGTYEITSKNLLEELIIAHTIHPSLNGKNSTVKFKLLNPQTLMLSWTPNGVEWLDEKWTRMPLGS